MKPSSPTTAARSSTWPACAIADPVALETEINGIVGVIAVGLFAMQRRGCLPAGHGGRRQETHLLIDGDAMKALLALVVASLLGGCSMFRSTPPRRAACPGARQRGAAAGRRQRRADRTRAVSRRRVVGDGRAAGAAACLRRAGRGPRHRAGPGRGLSPAVQRRQGIHGALRAAPVPQDVVKKRLGSGLTNGHGLSRNSHE